MLKSIFYYISCHCIIHKLAKIRKHKRQNAKIIHHDIDSKMTNIFENDSDLVNDALKFEEDLSRSTPHIHLDIE